MLAQEPAAADYECLVAARALLGHCRKMEQKWRCAKTCVIFCRVAMSARRSSSEARPSRMSVGSETPPRPVSSAAPPISNELMEEATSLIAENNYRAALRRRALSSWRVLRDAAITTTKTLERDAILIEHGFFKFEQFIAPASGLSIECVAFNTNTAQLWVEDFESARRWTGPVFDSVYNMSDLDRHRPFVPSTVAVKISERSCLELLFHPKLNSFIGYADDDNTLRLFDANMQIVSKTSTLSPATCACVDPFTGTVCFGCRGRIAIYHLRRGKIFTLKAVLDDGLPGDAVLNAMTVEYSAVKLRHRIFVAHDRQIVVFDIGGNLLTTIKDAHPRPVSALVFFDDVDSLVSASRDGSIKVWDAHWELIHIFAGHSSEVSRCRPCTPMTDALCAGDESGAVPEPVAAAVDVDGPVDPRVEHEHAGLRGYAADGRPRARRRLPHRAQPLLHVQCRPGQPVAVEPAAARLCADWRACHGHVPAARRQRSLAHRGGVLRLLHSAALPCQRHHHYDRTARDIARHLRHSRKVGAGISCGADTRSHHRRVQCCVDGVLGLSPAHVLPDGRRQHQGVQHPLQSVPAAARVAQPCAGRPKDGLAVSG